MFGSRQDSGYFKIVVPSLMELESLFSMSKVQFLNEHVAQTLTKNINHSS